MAETDIAVARPDLAEARSRLLQDGWCVVPDVLSPDAAAFALEQYKGREQPKIVRDNMRIFEERRDIMVRGLRSMGFKVDLPKGTFYLWVPVPKGMTSLEFTDRLFEKTAVVVAAGPAYGKYGEGFIRISLTVPDARLEEAMARIEKEFAK